MSYTNNDVVKLIVDNYKGKVSSDFANADVNEVITKAIFEVLGTDKIDLKALRRNNNKDKVFAIIEEAVQKISDEGLKGDEFFFNLVDYKNIADGDQNQFTADKDTTLVVAEIANGVGKARRQRIAEKMEVTVSTKTYGISVYDEFKRIASGRVNWNDLINAILKAITQKKYALILEALKGITASTVGMNSTLAPDAGSFSEDALMTLVDHIEAEGGTATIIGTRTALRKVSTATVSDEAKSDLYNTGFYGRFNGTNMVKIPNRHKVGTTTFILPDDVLWVVGSDDKPIKFVTEGSAYISDKDATGTADMTQEYTYFETFGVGVIVNAPLGVYKITG